MRVAAFVLIILLLIFIFLFFHFVLVLAYILVHLRTTTKTSPTLNNYACDKMLPKYHPIEFTELKAVRNKKKYKI